LGCAASSLSGISVTLLAAAIVFNRSRRVAPANWREFIKVLSNPMLAKDCITGRTDGFPQMVVAHRRPLWLRELECVSRRRGHHHAPGHLIAIATDHRIEARIVA
jgi:hypothetical protein